MQRCISRFVVCHTTTLAHQPIPLIPIECRAENVTNRIVLNGILTTMDDKWLRSAWLMYDLAKAPNNCKNCNPSKCSDLQKNSISFDTHFKHFYTWMVWLRICKGARWKEIESALLEFYHKKKDWARANMKPTKKWWFIYFIVCAEIICDMQNIQTCIIKCTWI